MTPLTLVSCMALAFVVGYSVGYWRGALAGIAAMEKALATRLDRDLAPRPVAVPLRTIERHMIERRRQDPP